MDIEIPEAPLNMTMTLKDDDTGLEITKKIHIYGNDEPTVLRSMSKSILSGLSELGVLRVDHE